MSGYQTFSDPSLVTLLRVGNADAYSEIYNRYYQLMFVFAFKKLRDDELAKDFVQELFTKLWVKREIISEDGNLSQYLYISLRSKILDFFDHQKVQGKFAKYLTDYTPQYNTAYADDLIREKQLASYIEKQIQNLPKKMKVVFLMSRTEQLSNREIAEQLNTTESNVSHHISNAVKILKSKIGSLLTFFMI